MKNRIIKFRAWDKEDREMYYDIQKGIKFTNLSHYTFDEFLENPKGMEDYHYWVVMQFTGLKDKNGLIDIYEKDILNAEMINPNTGETHKEKIIANLCMQFGLNKFLQGEVIGNIYENKNLLNK